MCCDDGITYDVYGGVGGVDVFEVDDGVGGACGSVVGVGDGDDVIDGTGVVICGVVVVC